MNEETQKPLLGELHTRYAKWLKDLNFYKDEVRTFNSRLEEVVVKNTKIEVTALIEQYQNQFIRQNEVIDILKHDIAEDHKRLVASAQKNNIATDHRHVDENTQLTDRMERFEELYKSMKEDYMRFLSQTL